MSLIQAPDRWDLKDWQVRALGFAALTGLIGVLSGFALFSYLWFAGDHADPLQIAAGLFVAAMMSFVFEWLREKIQPMGSHGHEHPPLTVGRWVTTVIMLLVFELFVVAWHSLPERQSAHFNQLAEAVSGLPNAPPWVDLFALMTVWVVVGSALAACLSRLVTVDDRPLYIRCARGAVSGAVYGLIIPPLAVLASVIVVRFCVAVGMMVFRPEDWNAHVENLYQGAAIGILKLYLFPIYAVNYVANLFGPGRPIVLLGAFGGFFYWYAKQNEKTAIMNLLAGGIVMLFIAPLLTGLGHLVTMLVLAALIWAIPMILLGAIAPLLAEPSTNRHVWGLSAFAAAAMLTGITAARLGWPPNDVLPVIWCIVAVLALGGGLVLILRHVEDAWPILALTTATLVWTTSLLMQQLTFAGVLSKFHVVNALPAKVGPLRPVAPVYDTDWLRRLETPDFSGFSKFEFSFPSKIDLSNLLKPGTASLPFGRPRADIERDIDRVAQELLTVGSKLQELARALEHIQHEHGRPASIHQMAVVQQRLAKLIHDHHTLQQRYEGLDGLAAGDGGEEHAPHAPPASGDDHNHDHEHHPKSARHDQAPSIRITAVANHAMEKPIADGDDSSDHGHDDAHGHASYQSVLDGLEKLCRQLDGTDCPDRPQQEGSTPDTDAADAPPSEPKQPAGLRLQLANEKKSRAEAFAKVKTLSQELNTQLQSARRVLDGARAELDLPSPQQSTILTEGLSADRKPADAFKVALASEPVQRMLLKSKAATHLETVTRLEAMATERGAELQTASQANDKEFADAERQLDDLTASVATTYWTAFDEYALLAAQRLELSLACSFGFWATIGLLIGWTEFFKSRQHAVKH